MLFAQNKATCNVLNIKQYMVCAGSQQSHRMTVNPGRIVEMNVLSYTWGHCLPILMMYYSIYSILKNGIKKKKKKHFK